MQLVLMCNVCVCILHNVCVQLGVCIGSHSPQQYIISPQQSLCQARDPWESQKTAVVQLEKYLSIQDFITIFLLGYNSEQYSFKYNNYESILSIQNFHYFQKVLQMLQTYNSSRFSNRYLSSLLRKICLIEELEYFICLALLIYQSSVST